MKCVGILGYGEIGSSIEKLYRSKNYDVRIIDPAKNKDDSFEGVEVINICIPYSRLFRIVVEDIIQHTQPKLTIIHSSVPVGTTKNLQELYVKDAGYETHIVHSPVRGNHPDLYYSLKSFLKYIGSDTLIGANLAREHFGEIGVQSKYIGNSKTTELAKLMCTTYYGICIAWHEEMDRLCKEHGIEFESAVSHWNASYNEGYSKLGMSNVIRPVLYPPKGKIGGHCVVPNAELLKPLTNSAFLDLILQLKK